MLLLAGGAVFPSRKIDSLVALIIGGGLLTLAAVSIYAFRLSEIHAGDPDLSRSLSALSGISLGGVGAGLVGCAFWARRPATDNHGRRGNRAGDEHEAEAMADVVRAARELACNRLPGLIAAQQDPSAVRPQVAPFLAGEARETSQEIVDLLESLNLIQSSMHDLADAQQRAVRAGVGDLVVDLVRRNQSLLDSQLETIDALESGEEDPDRLEKLFGLDHLATRMRRNAESLLVLAGSDPPKRRNGPVSVKDTVRVAVSEIDQYRRVAFGPVDDGMISGPAVVDLAHMLSELLENGTQFSPPHSSVEVTAAYRPDGHYLITITDQGIGMSADQLAKANATLTDPPELGLGLSRSLGFMVVGRLAQRLGITVELAANDVGLTASVRVPDQRIVGTDPDETDDGTEAPDEANSIGAAGDGLDAEQPMPLAVRHRPGQGPAQSEMLAKLRGHDGPGRSGPEEQAPEQQDPAEDDPVERQEPATLDDALPQGSDFDAGLSSLLPERATDDADNEGVTAEAQASPVLLPARVGLAPSGLARRDRSVSQAPKSEGRLIATSNEAVSTSSSRSPQEIRRMIARYRDGRHRGLASDPAGDEQPADGEPAEQE